MDAVEAKRQAFRARWLAITESFSSDVVQDAAPDAKALAPTGLIPRIVFREQAVAKASSIRRAPILTRARLVRGAVRLSIVLVVLAATSIGLQKVFKAAPNYFATFTTAIDARGAAGTRG